MTFPYVYLGEMKNQEYMISIGSTGLRELCFCEENHSDLMGFDRLKPSKHLI